MFVALIAAMQLANAQDQVKSISAAKSAVESAFAATQNPKKNTKVATWLKYGQSLVDAYAAPAGNAWIGMGQQELQLIGGSEKASSEEQVVVNGEPMTKLIYATCNYYFNNAGKLAIIEVTQPVVEGSLDKATEAIKKAAEVDAAKAKTKEIGEAFKLISTKYVEQAYNQYSLGAAAGASVSFAKAAEVIALEPNCQIDSSSIYNAAFTAWLANDYDRAKEYFGKCIDIKYYGVDGDAYAKLSDIAAKQGDNAKSKEYLEEAFTMFPQSQSILVGLINYYVSSGEDTNRLFVLLDEAKKNDPNNASLYYVEGNIREKLGQDEEAVAAYDKCIEVAPSGEYGYIGKGVHYYNKALVLQDKAAAELNDAKYMELMGEFEKALKSCIEPFEKAYELAKDDGVKSSVAEYLKNACFRFRNESPEYQAKYEKYSK